MLPPAGIEPEPPNHDKDGKRILYQRTSKPDINLTIRNVYLQFYKNTEKLEQKAPGHRENWL